MPHLQTERLTFLPYTLDLIQAIMQSQTELAQKSGFQVDTDWPQSDFAGIFPFLAERMTEIQSFSDWIGLIVHTAEQRIIGDMGFKSLPDAQGGVEIGYSVVPAYQGQGIATEMARSLIAWAFEQPGVTKVLAECLDDNIGSIRVLEKAGLRRVGNVDNMLRWELLK